MAYRRERNSSLLLFLRHYVTRPDIHGWFSFYYRIRQAPRIQQTRKFCVMKLLAQFFDLYSCCYQNELKGNEMCFCALLVFGLRCDVIKTMKNRGAGVGVSGDVKVFFFRTMTRCKHVTNGKLSFIYRREGRFGNLFYILRNFRDRQHVIGWYDNSWTISCSYAVFWWSIFNRTCSMTGSSSAEFDFQFKNHHKVNT